MAFEGGFDDGAHLHFEDFGIGNRKTAAAVAQHGVGFMELFDAPGHHIDADAEFLRQLLLLGAIVGHKFVKRRVDQANGDGKAVHGFEDADEITALKRQEPVERSHAGFLVVRENHLLNGTLALVALLRELKIGEEHVFGAAKPNPLGTEFARLAGVLGRIGIGAHAEMARFVGPLH